MFRKYYKAANDEILTNRDLINKIFDQYTEAQTKKKRGRIYNYGIRYGTAFAAVLVLCTAVAVYPRIAKLSEEPTEIMLQEKTNKAATNILPESSSEGAADQMLVNVNTGEVAEDRGTITDQKNVIIEQPDSTQSLKEEVNLNMARIAAPKEETQNNPVQIIIECEEDISKLKTVTEEEIMLATDALTEKLGRADKITGNLYSFEIVGRLEADEKDYYLGRWKWIADDSSSLICEFVLSDDLKELYECVTYDKTVAWTTMNNMF